MTNETDIAAYGLGNSLCSVLGRYIFMGLGAGLDTLQSQAWGAGEFKKVGLYAQRVFLIFMLLVTGPVAAAWWFAASILKALGQPEEVAQQTEAYARISLPLLPSLALVTVLTKTLLAMGKARPVLYCSLLSVLLVAGLLFGLVIGCNMGLLGAAIARMAATVTQSLALLAFAVYDPDVRKCWPRPSSDAFRGWLSYLRIGLPACFMTLAEFVSWDIVSFLAGLCTTASGLSPTRPSTLLAAQGFLQAVIALTYCVPRTFNRGLTTVIGNAVGAADTHRAARAAYVGTNVAAVLSAALTALALLLRGPLVKVLHAPKDVGVVVHYLLPYCAPFIMLDGLQMVLTGIIVGAGRQGISVPILVAAYWAIGLPAGAGLAFITPKPHLGLLGLWLGMTLAVTIHVGAYVLVCFAPCKLRAVTISWSAAVDDARRRLAETAATMSSAAAATAEGCAEGCAPLPPPPPPDANGELPSAQSSVSVRTAAAAPRPAEHSGPPPA